MSDINLNQSEEVSTTLPVSEDVATEETVSTETQSELVAPEAPVSAE